MPLIHCPDCGNSRSDQAGSVCPHCGHQIAEVVQQPPQPPPPQPQGKKVNESVMSEGEAVLIFLGSCVAVFIGGVLISDFVVPIQIVGGPFLVSVPILGAFITYEVYSGKKEKAKKLNEQRTTSSTPIANHDNQQTLRQVKSELEKQDDEKESGLVVFLAGLVVFLVFIFIVFVFAAYFLRS